MSKAKNPPWFMWGSETTLSIPLAGVAVANQTTQLARVSYGRPDTWTPLFVLNLLAIRNTVGAGAVQVFAAFDLTIGVGRASVTLFNYCTLEIGRTIPVPVAPNPSALPAQIFSTQAGLFTDLDSVITRAPAGSEFPGEDIQCNARVLATGSISMLLDVNVSAFFTPRTHVRPDWYGKDALGSGER
jgi:hypothetical protein